MRLKQHQVALALGTACVAMLDLPGAMAQDMQRGAAAQDTLTQPRAQEDAPDAGPTPTQRPAAEPSQIFVTARKRQESILQVPVVVTALAGEQLVRASAPLAQI